MRETPWEFDDFQKVFADTQLMGTKKQVQEAEKVALKVPDALSA